MQKKKNRKKDYKGGEYFSQYCNQFDSKSVFSPKTQVIKDTRAVYNQTQNAGGSVKKDTIHKKANATQHSGKVAHSLREMILMLRVREKQSQCHHASS